ncbi:MAG: hypothetical protein ACK4QP_05580 [Pseudorhizobium sp.]
MREAYHLSDFPGGKIIVTCEQCGIRRQYDADEMKARTGDLGLPEVLPKLAGALGCKRVESKFYDRCKMNFDVKAMGMTG